MSFGCGTWTSSSNAHKLSLSPKMWQKSYFLDLDVYRSRKDKNFGSGPINPKASNGHRFILMAIDYLTKWVEATSYANISPKVFI